MEYTIAKALHFLGLTLWFGILPLEAYCRGRLLRTKDTRARHSILRMINTFRFYQEYPGILLAVVGGVWMALLYGVTPLIESEWFLMKMGLVLYLVFAETYVTLSTVRMERRYKRAAERGEFEVKAEDANFDLAIVIETAAMFAVAAAAGLAVTKQVDTNLLLLALLCSVPIPLFDLKHLLRRRSSSPLAPVGE